MYVWDLVMLVYVFTFLIDEDKFNENPKKKYYIIGGIAFTILVPLIFVLTLNLEFSGNEATNLQYVVGGPLMIGYHIYTFFGTAIMLTVMSINIRKFIYLINTIIKILLIIINGLIFSLRVFAVTLK